jgi:predicted transcriptional regulator
MPWDGSAKDQMHKPVSWVTSNTSLRETASLMLKMAFSQLPVRDGDKVVGRVTELMIVRYLSDHEKDVIRQSKVGDLENYGRSFKIIGEAEPMGQVANIPHDDEEVLVQSGPFLKDWGIITRSDLIRDI